MSALHRANCLKSKSEEILGENKGKIMKDGAIAQLKIQKLWDSNILGQIN